MGSDDLTVKILIEIRDEIRKTNSRVDETNQRLDTTNQRLDSTNQRLDGTREDLRHALVESEVRTATAITALAGTLGDIKQLLTDRLDVRDRVDRCERDIAVLKARLSVG